MKLITAREAYNMLLNNRSEHLLKELPTFVADAIKEDHEYFHVDTLAPSVRQLLEEKGYIITPERNKEGFQISFDLSKPKYSLEIVGTDDLDSLWSGLFYSGIFKDINKSLDELKSNFHYKEAPDGVYILTSNKRCIRPDAWFSHKKLTPVGIAVIEGDTKRIIALTGSEESMKFSDNTNKVLSKAFSSQFEAKIDFAGITHFKYLLEDKSPAAQFCAKYSTPGMPCMHWYLPSLGELVFMQKHKDMIDASLTICGGKPLDWRGIWSSTEYSASSSWLLSCYDGDTFCTNEFYYFQVRPICAFL